jgi:isoleucyl-tRNA synthetase
MYKEFKGLNLPTIDKEILEFWENEKIFEKSYEQRDPQNSFVFYEGPPSANGMPGIHHVMARTIKDIFCRFQTLNGKRVERKGGWDTHGLPIELAVEKELGITKEDIGKKISVDDYNHKCRETVMRFKDSWDEVTVKSGYWVDLENPYITYENSYIETVWFLLKRLYEKGFLYKGYTIQPYSPAAGTGLSSHELNMPGTYKDVTDTTVVAMFKVLKSKNEKKEPKKDRDLLAIQIFRVIADDHFYILAWTTTPWTLPSNTALTVGGNLDYIVVKTFNPYTFEIVNVVLNDKAICRIFPDSKWYLVDINDFPNSIDKDTKKIPYHIYHVHGHPQNYFSYKGEELEGLEYDQLFKFGNEIQPINGKSDAFKVITDNFVTTEDGTGVVHTAPSFGADDRRAAAQNGIGDLTLVDKQGKFINSVKGKLINSEVDYSDRYVKNYTDNPDYVDVNVDIAIDLKLEGYAFNVQKYVHPYPHCWRTDKPILYYPLDSWFIAASKAKERMFELNKTINWKPAATGEGRFGKWLENLQDWNLSRSRYWGIGLPIWRTENVENTEGVETVEKCIGSYVELKAEIDKANAVLGLNQTVPQDMHRPYIDEIILVSDDGRPMKRETDLIDVWFDSGSMPYAQWGLDYEKLAKGDAQPFKTPFEISYPADFIAEGVDQTRGWFYTLHAIAVMAYDTIAFKNVVSNGLVQDKDGQKMSKSKGNAVEPFETIAKHGADATRWYMVSNAQPWDNLKFDIEGITEVRNKFFGTLYNTYNFFAMYANVDGFQQDEMNQTPMTDRIELDRWVLSRLHSLVAEVSAFYSDYEPTQAARAIEKFVDSDFSNWYVRLSRRRFWKGEMSDDKKAAYETMYQCLMVVAQLAAPIAPFFSDWMYRNLTENIRAKAIENNTPLRHASVHLTDLTKADNSLINKALEQRMDYAQRISSLILSLRKKAKIRVRQPLQKAMLPILDADFIQQVEGVKDLILAETNVKTFEYITDTSGVVKKKIKPNFKTLGKTLGANMKFAQTAIEALTQDDIAQIEKEKTFNLAVNGESYALSIDDFLITSEDIPGWEVASDGEVTVALDITLNEALIAEGTARDLVNKIQNIRKELNFNITDKITVKIEKHPYIMDAVKIFGDYIKGEVLATDLALVEKLFIEKIELNEETMLAIEVILDKSFISYSWDNKEHENKVLSFCNHLRKSGYHAEMDKMLSQEEASIDFIKMMHKAMTDYSKVIIVLSEGYKNKANSFKGGVGQEYQLIINDINDNPRKYVLVSFGGISDNIKPLSFKGREIIDISKEENWNKLFAKLENEKIYDFAPVASNKPQISKTIIEDFSIKVKKKAIEIVRIIMNNVGHGTNGGIYTSYEKELKIEIKNVGESTISNFTIEVLIPQEFTNGGELVQDRKKKYTWDNNKLFASQDFISPKGLNLIVNQGNIRNVETSKIEVKVFSDEGVIEKVFDLQDFVIDKKYNEDRKLTKEDFGLEY